MKTSLILMAQYDGRAIIPLWQVCEHYFTHLKPDELAAKAQAGEIQIPIVHMDTSRRTSRGVHLADLATYIERQTKLARKECRKLTGVAYGAVR
jgi:hypothetical protein